MPLEHLVGVHQVSELCSTCPSIMLIHRVFYICVNNQEVCVISVLKMSCGKKLLKHLHTWQQLSRKLARHEIWNTVFKQPSHLPGLLSILCRWPGFCGYFHGKGVERVRTSSSEHQIGGPFQTHWSQCPWRVEWWTSLTVILQLLFFDVDDVSHHPSFVTGVLGLERGRPQHR